MQPHPPHRLLGVASRSGAQTMRAVVWAILSPIRSGPVAWLMASVTPPDASTVRRILSEPYAPPLSGRLNPAK